MMLPRRAGSGKRTAIVCGVWATSFFNKGARNEQSAALKAQLLI
jgi:hypothetical protein